MRPIRYARGRLPLTQPSRQAQTAIDVRMVRKREAPGPTTDCQTPACREERSAPRPAGMPAVGRCRMPDKGSAQSIGGIADARRADGLRPMGKVHRTRPKGAENATQARRGASPAASLNQVLGQACPGWHRGCYRPTRPSCNADAARGHRRPARNSPQAQPKRPGNLPWTDPVPRAPIAQRCPLATRR